MDNTQITFPEKNNNKVEKQILIEISWLKKLSTILLVAMILQVIFMIITFFT